MSKNDEIIKDFEFHIPVELIKSDKEDDGAEDAWQIQGIASTAGEDLQGEVVDQNGLDISLLKAGRGLFNFDHQKGPENVIGQIEDADFKDVNGEKALFVKGYLFRHSERGKAFYNVLKSLKKGTTHRVHFSIEGKILKRSANNPKNIAKARIDKVALTFDPVNPVTYCSLVKSLNALNLKEPILEVLEESINIEKSVTLSKTVAEKLYKLAQKALAAGAGYAGAPGDMTGGSVMTSESMDKDPKKMVDDGKKKKKIKKSNSETVKELIEKAREKYPEADPMVVTQMVIESYNDILLKNGMKKTNE